MVSLPDGLQFSDEIKEDAKIAIQQMRSLNIKTVMLSGDKHAVVDNVAKTLNTDQAFGDLLPENKVQKVDEIKREKEEALAFVGDGINDAPVLAISDVGIAMGGLGSDAAIETADVVIQTDRPSKIVTAILIGKATNAIVWQNIFISAPAGSSIPTCRPHKRKQLVCPENDDPDNSSGP